MALKLRRFVTSWRTTATVMEFDQQKQIEEFSRYVVESRCSRSLSDVVNGLEALGFAIDLATYASLVRRCGLENALQQGQRVHAHIVRYEVKEDTFLGNLLVQMYGKCGSVSDAFSVFNGLQERNLYSWSMMITAYVKKGQYRQAIKLFQMMDCDGTKPNGVTFISVIGALCKLGALDEGRDVHERIIHQGFTRDIAVCNSLLVMYSTCGYIETARQIFDNMHLRNVVSWNAMISAYTQHGYPREAINLFEKMESRGVNPDRVTFITVLSACCVLGGLAEGKAIHSRIPVSEYVMDAVLGTALINMYSKAGHVNAAREVFTELQCKDVVSWAAMIAAYAQNSDGTEAIRLLWHMDLDGTPPNEVTFVSVLDACSVAGNVTEGKKIHSRLVFIGFESHITLGNALLNMYSNHGSLEDAKEIFDKQIYRDISSWNAMISAYTRHGQPKSAIMLLKQLDLDGVKPDGITFLSIFDACADAGTLTEGRKIHKRHSVSMDVGLNVSVGNSLINMYGRCWSLEEAVAVFQRMKLKDVVTWNSIIAAYGSHGHGNEALTLFNKMNIEGLVPDEITFVNSLFACSHGGLLETGLQHFMVMVEDFGMLPRTPHFGCLIDLLGRAGHLKEAENLIKSMPLQPDSASWTALLGACATHLNVNIASKCADELLVMEFNKAAPYVMLQTIYTTAKFKQLSLQHIPS